MKSGRKLQGLTLMQRKSMDTYNIVKDTAQVYFALITLSLFTMITPLGRYAFPLPSGCRPKCADV